MANNEMTIIKAINDLKGGDFDCIPLPEYRDPQYEFEDAIHNMVVEAGCELEWKDTFKGGCWHILPKS